MANKDYRKMLTIGPDEISKCYAKNYTIKMSAYQRIFCGEFVIF